MKKSIYIFCLLLLLVSVNASDTKKPISIRDVSGISSRMVNVTMLFNQTNHYSRIQQVSVPQDKQTMLSVIQQLSYGNIAHVLPENEIPRVFSVLWKSLGTKSHIVSPIETSTSTIQKDEAPTEDKTNGTGDFEEFIAKMRIESERLKKEAVEKKENLLSYADCRIICALAEKDSARQIKIMDEALKSIISTLEWVGMDAFKTLPMADDIIQSLLENQEMWKDCPNAKRFSSYFPAQK